jgi:hypothetical protein
VLLDEPLEQGGMSEDVHRENLSDAVGGASGGVLASGAAGVHHHRVDRFRQRSERASN